DERYRPSNWSDVIGQEKAVRQLQANAKRQGWSGQAYFISGASGTGKTTIARLIAGEVASDFNVIEVDASDCSPSTLKDIERMSRSFGMGDKPGRALIVNEAHGFKRLAVRELLVLLECILHDVVLVVLPNS